MNRVFYRVMIILTVLAFGCFLLRTYHINAYVNHIPCNLICLGTYKDNMTKSTSYKYQTDDAMQITFTVSKVYKKITTPSGKQMPIKIAMYEDDFADQICNYVSQSRGTYSITDRSVTDISDYVAKTVKYCEQLYDNYGIKREKPNINFTFTDGNEVYNFTCGYRNRERLYDNLIELIYGKEIT